MLAGMDGGQADAAVLGYTLALLSSASNAASQAANKALVQKMAAPELAIIVQGLLTALVFFAGLPAWPDAELLASWDLRLAVAVSGTINVVASQLAQVGLRRGELSDTVPFLSLTPAFLLVSEYLLLSESTNAAGAFGVLLVSSGGFLLSRVSTTGPSHKGKSPSGLSLPPGSGIFIVISIIYSVSSAFDRKGVRAGGALLYGAAIQVLMAMGAATTFWARRCDSPARHFSSLSSSVVCGLVLGQWLFSVAAYWCQLQANQRILSSHLSAVRRAGCLLGLLFGRIFFAEPVGRKLLPVSVMVFGVCLLSMK
eukprot:TRINITY_DN95045_c0_g1_i1.p1 TRINITY_DN95045_c0_g1~~TRINITY_DN95045_c0_g1_i1.p1  ORF type:complete len:318 (-),score=57.00 TRINITY_DN95045_c0_g1_i1:77-1009(-)